MSFLAPLFLLGAAAIALPVIFHLIRQTTKERQIFSSLMFLVPTPPKLTRRSRLQNVFLLLLRCLVLALLAFGFSRPFIRKDMPDAGGAGTARRIVLLVDTSASMRREGMWTEAQAKASEVLRKTVLQDEVSVFLFDSGIKRLVTFEQWKRMAPGERPAWASQQVSASAPGWSGTHLGNALIAAAEELQDSGKTPQPGAPQPGHKEIIVISDFQEGSKIDSLQAYEWPKAIELSLIPIKSKRPTNAGIQPVIERGESAQLKLDSTLRVRVSNSSESKREQFRLAWRSSEPGATAGVALDVYIPPGQSRVTAAPVRPANNGGNRIVLEGDEEPFDNAAYVIEDQAVKSSVLYLGNDAADDATQLLFFLRGAFQQTARLQVAVEAHDFKVPLGDKDLRNVTLVVAGESTGREAELHQFMQSGKTVLLVLNKAEDGAVIGRLMAGPPVTGVEAVVKNYAMLREIDFQHPLFAPFADPRFSDFTKIHFWRHRRLETNQIAGAHVVARFDDGDPALIEAAVGKGRLIILTSGWQPVDSQLALSSKFVPFLYALLEQTGGIPAQPSNFTVDESYLVSAPTGVTNGVARIRKPDGKVVEVPWGTAFSGVDQPGVYEVLAGETPVRRFAANLDASESRTAPLAMEELERLGLPVKHHDQPLAKTEEQKRKLAGIELESRQKLWRWLVVGALAFAAFETLLAGYITRKERGGPTG